MHQDLGIPGIRIGFQRLKQIHLDAVFPPVYFVIGPRKSAGTDSANGLIIGAEMFADTGSRIHLSDVVPIIIHELIHDQQQAKGEDLTTAVMTEVGYKICQSLCEISLHEISPEKGAALKAIVAMQDPKAIISS